MASSPPFPAGLPVALSRELRRRRIADLFLYSTGFLSLMLWRPRSIFQLVLLGFFIVVTPFCVATYLSLQTLNQQAVQGEQMTRELVALTRKSQQLQADLLDLERRARQYATLGDPSLLPLFNETLQAGRESIELLDGLLDQPQQQLVHKLSELLNVIARGVPAIDIGFPETFEVLAEFDRISSHNRTLMLSVEAFVDRKLNEQAQQLDELRAWWRNLVLSMALITLFAVVLFSYLINDPIRQIETEIRALGQGERERPVQISGPLEMRALGEQLGWLKAQLNVLEEQKRQFLCHMSHELKTPLASLREGADLMAEEVVGNMNANQREIVTILQQNSWELQRLIENLLDYNQALDQSLLDLHQVAIDALCQGIMEPYRILIGRRELQVQAEGGALDCLADGGKLKTALDNLFSNAVNYSDIGGRIQIDWLVDGQQVIIDVANSGNPVPAQEVERIFQPFYQGSTGRRGAIKGSGIGLSVARECIEAQGGCLRLIAKPDWSTCFRIELPYVERIA